MPTYQRAVGGDGDDLRDRVEEDGQREQDGHPCNIRRVQKYEAWAEMAEKYHAFPESQV